MNIIITDHRIPPNYRNTKLIVPNTMQMRKYRVSFHPGPKGAKDIILSIFVRHFEDKRLSCLYVI